MFDFINIITSIESVLYPEDIVISSTPSARYLQIYHTRNKSRRFLSSVPALWVILGFFN